MMERIATPSYTKKIIEQNSFYFKKNFGQNFLIDSNILENIIKSAQITKEDCVLEIGPGIGSLTQELAENAKKVIAIEIDKHLIPILKKTVGEYPNIDIRNQDILKTDIDALIEQENNGNSIKVVANLPYYITTPIVMDLLENHRKVKSITVMVQKEVADRLTETPGGRKSGAITYTVQYYALAEEIRTVQQSILRGGEKFVVFKSFNPPISINNWANMYVNEPRNDSYRHRSDYRDAPVDWLVQYFFDNHILYSSIF